MGNTQKNQLWPQKCAIFKKNVWFWAHNYEVLSGAEAVVLQLCIFNFFRGTFSPLGASTKGVAYSRHIYHKIVLPQVGGALWNPGNLFWFWAEFFFLLTQELEFKYIIFGSDCFYVLCVWNHKFCRPWADGISGRTFLNTRLKRKQKPTCLLHHSF